MMKLRNQQASKSAGFELSRLGLDESPTRSSYDHIDFDLDFLW